MKADGPFHYRDGQLTVEELSLVDLANDLAGQAAWVLSHSALNGVFAGEARCLPVGLVGPLEVLTMAAAAGWWTMALSSHELDLAERAGFPPERTVASAGWHDDGFVMDGLTRGIAALPAVDDADGQNIERIARHLGVEWSASADTPSVVGLEIFAQCGGLLAPLLRGGPTLVLDTVWDGCSGDVVHVLPVSNSLSASGETCDVLLTGLLSSPRSEAEPVVTAALVQGNDSGDELLLTRGAWVLLPLHEALACRPANGAHRAPQHVMVHGALWRPLDQRPLPPVAD